MKSLSIKKLNYKSKIDINTSRTNNTSNNYMTAFSTESSKVYQLPPIKKDLYKKLLMQHSSVLSKYISNFISNYTKTAEELNNINPELNSKILSKKNSINSKDEKINIKKTIREKNETEKSNTEKDNTNILCLSERENISKIPKINKRNPDTNFDRKLLYITEIQKNKKNMSPGINLKKIKSKIKINKNISLKKSSPNINIIFPKGTETFLPKSIDKDQELTFTDLKKLDKYFRRTKTYQPNILADWKERAGIDIKQIKKNYISDVENDVEYQSKVLQDQVKLLEGNIKYFNKNIITDNDFVDAFKSLSIKTKIDFNKSLEETIGILYLLPQLILLDFYELIKKFETIRIPESEKFIDKYVFDEFDNLIYNCNLLTEVSEFFHNCFDVYLILISEVDHMNLNFNYLTNIISAFEKARFNMIYVINSATNIIKYYKKDMNFINKFDNKLKIKKRNFERKILTNKIMNQFFFKKNPERQKKLMIESCLSEHNRDDSEKKAMNFLTNFRKKKKKPKFKSIINTKIVKKLLRNCNDEAKNIINTEIINNQIEQNFSEDEEILPNRNRRVIKINF